jgi:hypothetical protein
MQFRTLGRDEYSASFYGMIDPVIYSLFYHEGHKVH